MNEFVRISAQVLAGHQSVSAAHRLQGRQSHYASLSLNVDRHASGKYLIKDLINVLPQP